MTGIFRPSRLLLAGAIAAAAMAFCAAPAQAQFFGFWGARSFSFPPPGADAVHPSELPGIVADEGMRMVGQPYRNGQVFVVDAVDRRGWRHRLIIDAFSGDIVQSFGAGQAGAPPLPERRAVARIAPPEPYVIPGEGILPSEAPLAAPKPRASVKPPALARAPVETRPLAPPETKAVVPQPPESAASPVKPVKKPSVVARTPAEMPPTAKKTVPQMLPGYAPPAAAGPPPKVAPEPAPVAAVPPPPQPGPAPVPAREAEPAAVPAPVKPAVNDVPVAPLYEAPAKAPAGKVNDIPVAPLE